MLYYITTIVNRHVEFRMALNKNGDLGFYDEIIPCYTIFHKKQKCFLMYGPNILKIMTNSA